MRTDSGHSSIRVIVLSLCIGMALPGVVMAQGMLPSAPSASASQQKNQPKHTPKEFRESLQVVIETLKNDASRQALLKQLKALKRGAKATNSKQTTTGSPSSMLMGLVMALARHHEVEEAAGFVWVQKTDDAWHAVVQMLQATAWPQTRGYLVFSVLALVGWLVAMLLLQWAGRWLFRWLHWPLTLRQSSRLALLAAHFLRRMLPWVATFFAMYWVLQAIAAPVGVKATVLILVYIGLFGQLLAAAAEVLIALFAEGHRRVAARILQAHAIKPLFVIGALLSLGQVMTGEQLRHLLGAQLTEWLVGAADLLALLLAAWLVVRMRRPVAHMIRNRKYKRRSQQSVASGLLALIARIWYLPALFAIVSAMIAVVVGGTGQAFSRAALCAVLLLAMFVVNALLIRHRDKLTHKYIRGQYKKRLVRFGYVLVAFVGWAVFAEIVLWVWGYSLWGLGVNPGVHPLVTRALFGFGLTVLFAWLIWIFADIAISRALLGTARQSGKTAARAQTVTPMIRNIVFSVIVVIAGVVALANLGVNVTPLLAGAGIIGLAIGFGAQNLVQDLITGMFIVIEDSIAVGDFIQIGTYMGTVEGLNLRTVRLRDLDAVVHHITYSHIDSIHNMSRDFGITLLKIRIPHDMPIDDAITLMRETAMELRKEPWIGSLIRSPLEMQGVHCFDEGCPILRMRMRTTPEWQWDVGRAFNQLLKQRMERMEVTLGAPRLTVSMAADGGRQYSHGKNADVTPDHSEPQPGGA